MDMIITMGPFVEGYRIKEYLGVFSGSTVIGTGILSEIKATYSDTLGLENNAFTEKMEKARVIAIQSLKKKCNEVGADAIINVTFDYITFSPKNMIGVIVNGTAVKLIASDELPDLF